MLVSESDNHTPCHCQFWTSPKSDKVTPELHLVEDGITHLKQASLFALSDFFALHCFFIHMTKAYWPTALPDNLLTHQFYSKSIANIFFLLTKPGKSINCGSKLTINKCFTNISSSNHTSAGRYNNEQLGVKTLNATVHKQLITKLIWKNYKINFQIVIN